MKLFRVVSATLILGLLGPAQLSQAQLSQAQLSQAQLSQAQLANAHRDPLSTRTYAASDAVIANPERGFYHHTETHYRADGSGYTPLDLATLQGFRTQESVTQILRVFYLEKFAGADKLDRAYLDLVRADFATARAAGVKVIVRFAYAQPPGWPPTTPYGDAPVARVVKHIAQLAAILRANSDVIAVVQSGFVGLWGEGYYTDHFADPADPSQVSDQNWADRRTVVLALLRALPRDLMVQVRTPYMKQRMLGLPTGTQGALSPDQAYDGSAAARIGHHNDCFLASPDDFGTYLSDPIELDKDFVAQDTNYVPEGGETCAVNSPRSDWPSAAAEMERLHFSYLNTDYNRDVLGSWGDNIKIAQQKLGYRLSLVRGTFTARTKPGGAVGVGLDLRNDGWAAPYRQRKVQLIFQGDKQTYRVDMPADPRRWAAGTTTTLDRTVCAPVRPGRYRLLLNLADASPRLDDPAYAVQLANTGTWRPATGYNDLGHTITVEGRGLGGGCGAKPQLIR
ncbi:DUF4832 domain-containing protein [Kribbella sandramycini]|uniref:DUF4832 domain-containing protein n=1 Tax=Kribbella sandramycini TaxID=60450 RepID=A0A7Y4KYL5_9ACTN|nr:DUF4832 domain-containing protein [Kribbella sandramycini]MBB6569950.1 hypothetical protein [Kribbella sandramycini]NOL40226.1 DUF4832 domain-containing protein [Kribbella sandramycini]